MKFANVLEQMGATVEWEANSITVSRKEGTKLKGECLKSLLSCLKRLPVASDGSQWLLVAPIDS